MDGTAIRSACPAADPVEEVKVGFDILKSLRLRTRGINWSPPKLLAAEL